MDVNKLESRVTTRERWMLLVTAATIGLLAVPVFGWFRLCRDWLDRLVGNSTFAVSRPDVVGALLATLAGLVLAVTVLHFAHHWFASWRLLRTYARMAELKSHHGTRFLAVSDERPFAMAVGILRPRIMLSTGLIRLLDHGELAAVLAHESSHVRHRDTLRYLITASLSRAFFFVPAIPRLAAQVKLAAELRADAEAGDESALGAALVKLADHAVMLPVGVAAASSELIPRLERLVDPAALENRFTLTVRTVLLSILVLAALTLGAFDFGNAHAFVAHAPGARCLI